MQTWWWSRLTTTVLLFLSRKGASLTDEPITITVESRVSRDPYQVYLRVGSITSEGNTYTASISGCI